MKDQLSRSEKSDEVKVESAGKVHLKKEQTTCTVTVNFPVNSRLTRSAACHTEHVSSKQTSIPLFFQN